MSRVSHLSAFLLGTAVVAAAATSPATAAPTEAADASPPIPQPQLLRSAGTLGDGAGRDYLVQLGSAATRQALPDGVSAVPLAGPAFRGVVARLTPAQARSLAGEPGVRAVVRDEIVRASADIKHPLESSGAVATAAATSTWGLDRTDQLRLPLDGQYTPPSSGAGVHVYVIDSGIVASPEFQGRIGVGAYVDPLSGVQDCDGHGTHVSGTIGSSTYGMAKSVVLHPVRVLDCGGQGSVSGILAGMNWVAATAPARSVVNMSLGGAYNPFLNEAVQALTNRGLVVVAAAGNEGENACDSSPGSADSALTIGAVDRSDQDTSYSNFGPCLDLYAPGTDIVSTDYLGGSGAVLTGTSMAAPHVAGAVAVLWSLHPTMSGPAVRASVVARASRNVLTFPFGQGGSPNLNLNVDWPTIATAPSALRSIVGNRRVALTWAGPAFTGNAPLRGYRVERRLASGSWTAVTALTAARGFTATGLTNGGRYQFRVAAVNTVGVGAYATSPVVVPKTVPGRPGKPQIVVRKKRRASVSWSAAAANGAAVTYVLAAKTGAGAWRAAASTTRTRWSGRVPAARKGKITSFRVQARNLVGRGPVSVVRSARMR